MDTVVPGEGIVPVLDGDILRTDGRTVLGGDDKSGIAIICEALRVVKENQIPCSDVDVVFTICEEAGLIGAKCLDVSRLRARTGLVLDSDSVGFLFTEAPAANRMEFHVRGLKPMPAFARRRESTRSKSPLKGSLRCSLGRIDHETTANIGVIEGGMAVNIVPNSVVLRGGARSHSEEKLERQTQHMLECLRQAARQHVLELDGKRFQASVEAKIDRDYDRMDVPDDSAIVRLVQSSSQEPPSRIEDPRHRRRLRCQRAEPKGLEVANLSTGMREIHTVHEWLDLKDLYLSAQVVLEIVRLNGATH